MAELGPSGEPQHAPLQRNLLGCQFTYDNINLLQCNGYSFDSLPDPEIFHEKYYDINYWKAQLAFRGASSAGNNMVELIERCIHAELPDRIHPRVAVATIHLSRRWGRLTWGEDQWSDDEEEEWEEDWESEGDDEEIYDGETGNEEEDEGEDQDDDDEDMDEDDPGFGFGGFEEPVNDVSNGGGDRTVIQRSYRL
ncbi:hypothetical protein BOTCAL_0092g00260 [Botryotinia calthae]|uniref:Uncharacterized protein n=1 Tax=Botryotinia calthae TaxID=38488 RepID=A0A4Y8D6V1_9HELO|nr:hypothetical protein BOTCAL_0092g00260 [Botryotinia calthae]